MSNMAKTKTEFGSGDAVAAKADSVDYKVDSSLLKVEEVKQNQCAKIDKLFKKIDKDGDGIIDGKEMIEWATKNQEAADSYFPNVDLTNEESFTEFIKDFDVNKDSKL